MTYWKIVEIDGEKRLVNDPNGTEESSAKAKLEWERWLIWHNIQVLRDRDAKIFAGEIKVGEA